MAAPNPAPAPGLFKAVASSTRPIYQLLRCINFKNKVHVQIKEDGIRIMADYSRVMQGIALLDKALFTTFNLNLEKDDEGGEPRDAPDFQISLPALLETLQIFGAADAAARQAKSEADSYRSNLRNYRADAFSNQTLGMPGTCCFSLPEEGSHFSIIIEEAGVKTTCNLVTYIPESPDEVPFDRDDVAFKIIMQARWLLDALAELAPTAPDKLTITATKTQPYLRLSTSGPLGSSCVDFAKGRGLLETFHIQDRWVQSFKFDMIKTASEAMRIASKVSFSGDRQGVLRLQFMVEIEGGGRSFLDFLFVPYISNEDEEDEDEDDG